MLDADPIDSQRISARRTPYEYSCAILAMLTVGLSACNDQKATSTIAGPDENAIARAEWAESRPIAPPGISLVSRFAIDVEVNGSFRPESPVSISLVATGLRDSEQAELSLHLPEVSAARVSEFGRQFTVPVEASVPPEAVRMALLGKGQQKRIGHILQIPKPGYYRIDATVRNIGRSSSGSVDTNPYVKDVAQKTVWLWIAPDGGRVTPGFDETLFPQGSVAQPGPLRWREKGGLKAGAPETSTRVAHAGLISIGKQVAQGLIRYIRENAPFLTSTTYPVEYQALYWDPIDDIYRPIANAVWEATWEDYSDPYNIDEHWETGTTDVNGYFTVDCPGLYESSKDGFVQARGAVRVEGPGNIGGSPVNVSGFGVGYDDCLEQNSWQTVASISETPHVFRMMSQAKERSNSWFGGYTRGGLVINVEHQSTACGDNSCYKDGSDEIHLLSDSTARLSSGDHVWGQWGTFIQYHEYGHAFHYKALGGPAGGIDCPGDHFIGLPSSRSCAFGEGFDDFFAGWIGGDELTSQLGSDYRFEGNEYRSVGDGLIIEGAVAGFLYDLVDSALDPNGLNNQSTGSDDDPVAFPGWFVGDVITTCTLNGYIDDPNGIDEFIYCAERAVDAENVGSQYSSHWRSYISVSVAGSDPTGWSKQVIRDLWLHNLYNQ